MNYYEAKFARERKANPTHWIIVPRDNSYTQVELRQIGGSEEDDDVVEGTSCTIHELRELGYGLLP